VGHVGEKWSFLELELRSRQGGNWNKVKATLCCAEYFCNFTVGLAFLLQFSHFNYVACGMAFEHAADTSTKAHKV